MQAAAIFQKWNNFGRKAVLPRHTGMLLTQMLNVRKNHTFKGHNVNIKGLLLRKLKN